jgi:tetratricopeptide (TPR) repeat protein
MVLIHARHRYLWGHMVTCLFLVMFGFTTEALTAESALPPNASLDEAVKLFKTKKDIDGALKLVDEVIVASPDFAPGYSFRGYLLRKGGDLNGAVDDFNEAIRLAPTDFYPHMELGDIFHSRKQLDEALTEYDTALELKPTSYETLCGRGRLFRARGQLEEAIANFTEATELKASDRRCRFFRAETLFRKGELKAATAEIEKAALSSLFPGEYPQRFQTLQTLTAQIAQSTRAIQSHGATVETYERRTDAYTLRAQWYEFHQLFSDADADRGNAIADLSAVLRTRPQDIAILSKRGHEYVARGEHEKGFTDLDQCIRLQPHRRQSYLDRGKLHRDLRKFADALADYEQADMPFWVEVTTRSTQLQVGEDATATVSWHEELHVTQVDGEWLWVEPVAGSTTTKSGWLQDQHVR